MNKLTKKCVAAIASLAMAGTLCVAGAVTMASVAWGVPRPDPNRGQQQPLGDSPDAPWYKKTSDTDPEPKTEGTLTIKKYKYKDSDDHKGEPLDGAKFTLTKVTKIDKVDLKYNEFSTWSTIAGIVDKLNRGDAAGAKITLGEGAGNVYTATTTNGTVEIKNLKAGLYKVVETPPTGYGAADKTEFYITMPLIETTTEGNNTTTTYNWNKTIEPKNKDISKTFTKTLDNGEGHNSVLAKDKTLYYTISASVNRTKTGTLTKEDLDGFAVFDDFPTDAFGTDVNADDAVASVKMGTGDDAKFDKSDYEVSIVKAASEKNGENLDSTRNRILVKFNEDGLGKIAEKLNAVTNGQDPKVDVTIKLDLNADYQGGDAPAGDKKSTTNVEVKNKSGFFPASTKSTPDADKPGPIVSGDDDKGTSTVKFGFLQVDKHDKTTTTTKLSGAVFKIFNSGAKAEACKAALLKRSAGSTDVPTECSDGASKNFAGTTDDQGKFATDQKVIAGRMVYLVEVTAPTDYALANEVRGVTVEEGKTTTVDFPNTKISDLKIDTWFNLPATGAAGVILFALAGMGLIAASVFLYMRNRKEEEQQAKA